MNKYYYDLHIHSCLSPCGDNDMTVNNIAGMAAIKGLNLIALTDHNTSANCPAFFEACRANGIVPIPGMEITTSEDIHLVSLFPTLEKAMSFEKIFTDYRMKLVNKPEKYGDQLILDAGDNVVGHDEWFLPAATSLSLEDAVSLVRSHDGFCYPAHIDREANGIIAILGTLPEEPGFNCVEFSPNADKEEYKRNYPSLESKHILTSSDAHYLWDISEAENFLMIDDEPYSGDLVRKKFFEFLKGSSE